MAAVYVPPRVNAEEVNHPLYPAIGLDVLLRHLIDAKGSDLHLTEGDHPRLRIRGGLMPLTSLRLDTASTEKLLRDAVPASAWERFLAEGECDTSYAYADVARFRVNIARERGRVTATLRAIPSTIAGLETLGLPEVIGSFADAPRGLVLVTGPTGSGKSTTLASVIDLINRRHASKIITIEDPIEFEHSSKKSLVIQREVGRDTAGFTEALKRALRQDPDVILVGEMRDYETISTAITAAETGHLVLATLHTSSAPESISRIVNAFPGAQQNQVRTMLAAALNAVVCQTLCPTADGLSRVPALEVMVVTDGIRNLIRENKIEQIGSYIQSGRDLGSQTLDFHLAQLVREGRITYDVALDKSADREQVERFMAESGAVRRPGSGQEL